jgi:transcription elongation factor SPT6
MSTRDFFDTAAELGSEEDDEDFDDENGPVRPKKINGANGIEDSSEEEDEDDDELLAKVSCS